MFKKLFQQLNFGLKKIGYYYKLRKQLQSSYFFQLTEEILFLASLAERVLPLDEKLKLRLNKIKSEMAKLQELTKDGEFDKVPLHTRLDLKNNLEVSKKQLEETLGFAQPQTKIIQ
ncbi:MAG: hypothetical protein Q9M37_07600 [Desulfonauticus sp.]|nr:hypothetical protein [Desulfonauticus sp.]